ncbi:ras-related protein Rab-32A-like [Xenia sp. Carnegie-2017]|uniref:ras-related protein Rab-32A-like n=1 Tax=Xenia sp. Carnegie-2017 TaxID=2897299 RepID=UPI001F041827|nr:ras-related protein Rab-32A-like [Xenia sp. Carnegie-2017]
MAEACVVDGSKDSSKHKKMADKVEYKNERVKFEEAELSTTNLSERKKTLKIVCVGDYCGGWSKGVYIEDYTSSDGTIVENPNNFPVIGATFATKCVCVQSGEDIRVILWNTAENERFFPVNRTIYRNADGAVVFWGAKGSNMDSALKYHHEVTQIEPDIPIVLLVDNVYQMPVNWIGDGMATQSREEMDAFCARHGFFAWFEMQERAGGEQSVFALAIKTLIDRIISLNPKRV